LSSSAWLNPKFLLGQKPPPVPMGSPDNIDFYNEHAYGYAFDGRTLKSGGAQYRMTADHYWFLNFSPIKLNLPGKNQDNYGFPIWCQADDYVFKQLEEAQQAEMASMLFTGRGFGKSVIAISLTQKQYVLVDRSYCVISASADAHANTAFQVFQETIEGMEALHPTLRQKRLKDDTVYMKAGEDIYEGDIKKTVGSLATVEKIIYANKPGKTKGRRLDGQHWEEGGDWEGASLLDCWAASEGTWRIGGIWKPKFVIITGTGGTVRSGQAKEMFMDPLTYNIYPVTQHDGRKTGIFMPTYKKYGGFYEQEGVVMVKEKDLKGMPTGQSYEAGYVTTSGVCDEEGVKKELALQRDRRKNNGKLLDKFTQEYPNDVDECFRQSGASVFQRHLLAEQKKQLTVLQTYRTPTGGKQAERGDLIWMRNPAGHKTGVRFVRSTTGKILVWEHPEMNERGEMVEKKHAYIGGLDSIDQSKEDSIGKDGSKLCLLIKKRQAGVQELSNLYVCAYADRPEGPVEEAYDNVLKVLTYYNCRVNLEYTKISIVPYFKQQKEYWRFIQRPKNFQADKNHGNPNTTLIGTQMTEPVRIYGTGKIKNYIESHWMMLFFDELLDQLLEYTVEKKTMFDWVIAMMLCEIADEDMAELVPAKVVPVQKVLEYGYYYDPYTGHKKYGPLPGQETGDDSLEALTRRRQAELRQSNIRWVDAVGVGHYAEHGVETASGPNSQALEP